MYKAYAKSRNHVKIESCSQSFFEMIESICQNRKIEKHPFHRMCTIMRRMGAKTLIKEDLKLNDELYKEKEQLAQRCGGDVELKATRYSFFREDCISTIDGIEHIEKDNLLCYGVIVDLELPTDGPDRKRAYLHESVVKRPGYYDDDNVFHPVSHYFLHNSRKFKVPIGSEDTYKLFNIEGCFFAQQNSLTHVCAHAALRTSINSTSLYKDLLPELCNNEILTNTKINDLLKLDFNNPDHRFGYFSKDIKPTKNGLVPDEIKKVIQKLGGNLQQVDFRLGGIDFDQYIYPHIESNFPTLLAIEGKKYEPHNNNRSDSICHVVTCLGHSINADRWVEAPRCYKTQFPFVPYISTVEWSDHFIINDDNYGMYVTLPPNMISDHLRNLNIRKKPQLYRDEFNLKPYIALSILPASVNSSGIEAEQGSMRFAQNLIKDLKVDKNDSCAVWITRLKEHDNRIVCRTLLQKRDEYIKYLKLMESDFEGEITKVQLDKLQSLPDYIWVTELTIPQIYTGNCAKLGDVIVDPSVSKKEYTRGQSIKLIWLPGFIHFFQKTGPLKWFITKYIPLIGTHQNNYSVPPIGW